MKELLTSGAVGTIELNAQKKIRQDIQERWNRLGLVEGLEGNVKETVATLYENQAKHLLREATASDNSGSFETVVFPLIRRVFSKLLANDIVSVQAMNLPIGKLFYIKPVTSEREWNFQTEGEIKAGDTGRHRGLMGYERADRNNDGKQHNRYYLPDEAINELDVANGKPEVTQYMKKSLYDLFYNDFLYDNSKGKITINVGEASPVEIKADGTYGAISEVPVYNNDGSCRTLMLQLKGFHSYNAGRLTGPDGNEMDTETFLASLKVMTTAAIEGGENFTHFAQGEVVNFRVVTQKYGEQLVNHQSEIADKNGNLYIELDLTKPVKKQGLSLDGYIGVDPSAIKLDSLAFQIAWCSYDSLELETEMGEVSFQLT
jgi:hypothetical protein